MTKHSIERARERAGLSKQAALNNFKKAYSFGIPAEELPSRESKYMLEKSDGANEMLLYGDFLYLFKEDGTCITMYHTPAWFNRKSNYDGKEKIRNPKKYFNKYQDSMAVA